MTAKELDRTQLDLFQFHYILQITIWSIYFVNQHLNILKMST